MRPWPGSRNISQLPLTPPHPPIPHPPTFLKDFMYLLSERGGGRERKHWSSASGVLPTRIPAHNPGTCPDWKCNRWPSGSQASTQSTEPHQPGPTYLKQTNIVFTFRERTGRRKIGREISMYERYTDLLLLAHPQPGRPDPQPKHVPCLGIEQSTLPSAGQHSIHWATPARAHSPF